MIRARHTLSLALISAAAIATFAMQANAAGFYIQEQSVRGLGSAFSGSTTTLDDASIVYFNPAGMTNLTGTQIQAGAHLLIPNAKMTNNGSTIPLGGAGANNDGGNPYKPTPVPNGFVTHAVNDRVSVGIGVTAPFGLGSEYDDGWFGRYDSTKTELKVIDIQPTVAYKINNMVSIGAGVNIQHADANLQNRVTNGVTEGDSKLAGDDWGFGYSLGVQVKPTDATTIGINYKSEVHHNLQGRIQVTGVAGLNEDSKGGAKLNLPDHLTMGVAHKINDKLTLQGQATWFGWNNFESIRAVRENGTVAGTVVQNYQTTWAFAVGAEYAMNDQWTLRGGVQFDETPTTDEYRTSRTPDGDRTWVSAGATYALTPKIDLDMAATYIHVDDGTINVSRNAGLSVVRAKTEGSVGILALGMSYKF
jgi:long-chain fatty acid transport protein